jgi:hypothetical protein
MLLKLLEVISGEKLGLLLPRIYSFFLQNFMIRYRLYLTLKKLRLRAICDVEINDHFSKSLQVQGKIFFFFI